MTYTMTYRKQGTITLNTDLGEISGNTYAWKNDIKENFPGIQWDSASKTWKMDGAAMQEIIEDLKDWFTRVLNLEQVTQETETIKAEAIKAEANEAPKAIAGFTKPCPYCGTYCQGDCRSH